MPTIVVHWCGHGQEFITVPDTAGMWWLVPIRRGGVVTPAVLRQATIADIAAMHRVRLSVHENRLVFSLISESDFREHLEKLGRGWVVEIEGKIIGFAIANATNGNVWALFVHPDHERRGYGRQLHDVMVSWLWEQGVPKLWLTTESAGHH